MQIVGKLIEVMETQQVTDKFKKREFVVEYAENPKYPEQIKFQLNQDSCVLINKFDVGDEIEVHFNLTGKAWTNKDGVTNYFNNLVAWKLILKEAGNFRLDTIQAQPEEKEDDLPF